MLGEALASILRSRLGQYLDTQVTSNVISNNNWLLYGTSRVFFAEGGIRILLLILPDSDPLKNGFLPLYFKTNE